MEADDDLGSELASIAPLKNGDPLSNLDEKSFGADNAGVILPGGRDDGGFGVPDRLGRLPRTLPSLNTWLSRAFRIPCPCGGTSWQSR